MENINTTPEIPIQSFTTPTLPTPQKNIYKVLFFIFFILFLIVTSVLTTLFITNIKNTSISKTSQISPTSVPIKTSVSYTAKSVQDDINSVSKLVLIDENQKETIISESKYLGLPAELPMARTDFRDLTFSSDYKFLYYMTVFYEGGNSNLYDIKNEKEISLNFPAGTFGFTPDSKYFYACAREGMLGGGAIVIDLIQSKNIFTTLEKSFICEYDQENKEIKFIESNHPYSEEITGEYVFSEKSGTISKTK